MPGEVVPLEIALGPSSTLFHAGDSVRLLVAGRSLARRNPLMGSFPASYVPGIRALRAALGTGNARRLIVPVIPQTE